MRTINRIDGIFFRAHDPAALAEWNKRRQRVGRGGDAVWSQTSGPTVFAPFRVDSDGFPADLAPLIADLTAAGRPAETRAERDGERRSFTCIHDPYGNSIERWQPPGTNA